MPKKKGTGKAGGGLKARIADWEGMRGNNKTPTIKVIDGQDFRKPGSQKKGER